MFGLFTISKEQADRSEPEVENHRQKVLASLAQFELPEKLHAEVIDRLVLLEKESKFNEDSRRIERGMDRVLDKVLAELRLELSPEQRSDARLAAILHDIGKSGPVGATPAEQEMIVKIFADEKIREEKLLVADALPEVFGGRSEEIQQTLEKYGIHDKTTMREFWDMHARWTHDILEKYSQGVNQHVWIIAGSHHIDHGINPFNLPEGKVPLAANVIGTMEDYVDAVEGRILIALDKYEAQIRRSKSPHEVAIKWVNDNLAKSSNFKEDDLMKTVIRVIDELGKEQNIFEEIKK